MNYKVGDKVKIIKSTEFPDMIGKTLEVTEVASESSLFACRTRLGSWNCLMYDWEIEKIEKGRQLLFPFMSKQ